MDPTDTVRCDQAVGNVTVVAFCTKSGVANAKWAAVEADMRKHSTTSVANSEHSRPIRPVMAESLTLIVETVESDGEAIQ